jgi:hypothetical protein
MRYSLARSFIQFERTSFAYELNEILPRVAFGTDHPSPADVADRTRTELHTRKKFREN